MTVEQIHLEEALRTARSPRERVLAHLSLSCFLDTLDNRRGLTLAREALTLARNLGEGRLIARAFREIGRHQFWLADYAGCLANLNEALRLADDLDEQALEADCHNGIGIACWRIGEPVAALEHLDRSREILLALDEAEPVGPVLSNLALVHLRLGDPLRARTLLQQFLEAARAAEVRFQQGQALINLAHVTLELGDLEEAQRLAEEALIIAREVHCPASEVHARTALARVLEARREPQQAIELLERALQRNREDGRRESEASNLLHLGILHQLQGNADRAVAFLEESIAVGAGIGLNEYCARAHHALSELFAQEGDPVRALEHFRRYHAVELGHRTVEAETAAEALAVRLKVERARLEGEIYRLQQVEMAAMNEQLREQARQLVRLSAEDYLTGLPNRRTFLVRFAEAFERARETGRPLAIALVDVDRFRTINERFSQAVGDEALQALGRILREACQPHDIAARYGGEEFALLFWDATPATARSRCDALRTAVETAAWDEIAPGLSLTLSVGLCADMALEQEAKMLAEAEAALYVAKRSGRNRVSIARSLQREAAV